MATVRELLKYLETHRGGVNQQRGTLQRAQALTYIDDAVRQTAELLMMARAPWMQRTWLFDLVANKASYLLRAEIVAEQAGAALGGIDNFGRPAHLYVRSSNLQRWLPITLEESGIALEDAANSTSSVEVPTAYVEMTPGVGNFEHDYAIVFPNPPKYSVTDGARLSFYVLPSALPGSALDGFSIALPSVATRYLKLCAEKELYRSEGRDKDLVSLAPHLVEARDRLTEMAARQIDDRASYVREPDDHWNAWGNLAGWGLVS